MPYERWFMMNLALYLKNHIFLANAWFYKALAEKGERATIATSFASR